MTSRTNTPHGAPPPCVAPSPHTASGVASIPSHRSHLAAWAFLLPIALLAPLSAQTSAGTPADQRIVVLRQVDSNGQETVKQQPLASDEGLIVHSLNGKVVSSRVVRTTGDQRVIIKFKGGALAQQFKQGVRKSDARAAKQQMEKSRDGFRERLLSVENRHRTRKGHPAATPTTLVAREYTYCLNGMAVRLDQDALTEVRQMPEVESLSLDQERHKCDGYGVEQIGAPILWQGFGITGQGEVIAIVDTGIDYRHPDLGGGMGPGKKVIGGYDFINDDADPDDDNGHGTHVAGIAAANGQIKGVAPDASLLAVKVLDNHGSGWDSDIIAGIEWAVANGANIINMSLGGAGSPDDPLSQAVDQATQAGVLVVAAAGNNYTYETIGSPGAARTALTVGAIDQFYQVAWFSSRGPAPFTFGIKPEVVAPGVGILSTVPSSGTELSDPSGYAMANGTSMAAPHVAGAAALLRQMHPELSPQQLKSALMASAADIGQDVMTQGSGAVNVLLSAITSVVSSGEGLSLGWDDLRNPTFDSVQPITYTNASSWPVQVALSTQFVAPAGMQVSVTPASLSLQPGESQTVNFSVNVDNRVTPNLPAMPFTYAGQLVATLDDGNVIHRPFALCKAPKFRVAPDDTLLAFTTFHGTDTPTLRLLFSQGPIETLMPAGTYDFSFTFTNFTYPPVERTVVREQVDLSTYADLSISAAEAKHKLEFKPIDNRGNPLAPDWTHLQTCVRHKASGFGLVTGLSGFPIAVSSQSYVSDVSSAFQWEGSLGGLPNDSRNPAYVFNASLPRGIASSRMFTYTPRDLNKTVLTHAAQPGQSPLTLTTSVWDSIPGIGANGLGHPSIPTTAPLVQTIYANVPREPDSTSGFWSADAAGPIYSGNLPPWGPDALYRSPLYRPISRDTVEARDAVGLDLYRTNAKQIPLGQGPAHWSGSLANQPDRVRVQAALGSMTDAKLFHGQCQEELVHGALPYTLSQNNQIVATGTTAGPTDPFFLWGQLFVVDLAVTPGAYDLAIPFTGFTMAGKPGQLEVRNQFDTTRSDPNPPYLTGFRLTDSRGRCPVDSFLSAIPPAGADLEIGVLDNVAVKEASLSFQEGKNWRPLPLHKVDSEHYTAHIPGQGPKRDSVNLKLVVRDPSGNSLTLTETIACEKR